MNEPVASSNGNDAVIRPPLRSWFNHSWPGLVGRYCRGSREMNGIVYPYILEVR
mgnify:CR=1 FL=1